MRILSLPITNFLKNQIIDYPTSASINYLWGFGSLAGVCLGFQLVSGILLAMHYTPHIDLAFFSVEHIMRDVNSGWLLRYIHANGASMFFIVVYIHISRGLYFGSFNWPRIHVWLSGVLIFFLMMATAFMGYVLPWGQMSFWGATVITNLFSAIPLIGEDIAYWLWGGFSVGNATLNRFFSLHYLLPFVIAGLAILHLLLLHATHVSSSTPLGLNNTIDKIPFYPYFYVKDLVGFFYFLFGFSFFVFFYPNVLGHSDNYIEANALVTPAHIVPEWYFLPFYAILRSIPDKLGGVVAMGLAIAILFLLPFINFSKIATARFRPLFQLFYWLLIFDFFILGWLGGCPVEYPFVLVGQLATLYYFFFFICLFPYIGVLENFFIKKYRYYRWINVKYSKVNKNFFYGNLRLNNFIFFLPEFSFSSLNATNFDAGNKIFLQILEKFSNYIPDDFHIVSYYLSFFFLWFILIILRTLFAIIFQKKRFAPRFFQLSVYALTIVGFILFAYCAFTFEYINVFIWQNSIHVHSIAFVWLALLSVFLFIFWEGSRYSFMISPHVYNHDFFMILFFAMFFMYAIPFVNDFVLLFVFLEALSYCLYVLAAADRNSTLSIEAGVKYFMTGCFGTTIFLLGMSLIHFCLQTSRFNEIYYYWYAVQGKVFSSMFPRNLDMEPLVLDSNVVQLDFLTNDKFIFLLLIVAIWIYLIGFLFKLGAAPFHYWLPDVYQGAPLSITYFFSVPVKFTFFFPFFMVYGYVFGFLSLVLSPLLLVVGACSLFVGSFALFKQTLVKRFFAYSSINHVGFILCILGSWDIYNVGLAAFYLFSYCILMSTIFMFLLFFVSNKKTNLTLGEIHFLRDLQKISWGESIHIFWITFFLHALFVLALFSLAGIPPFLGFVAKLSGFKAVIASYSLAKQVSNYFYWFLFGIAIFFMYLSSAVSAFNYLRVFKILIAFESRATFTKLKPFFVSLIPDKQEEKLLHSSEEEKEISLNNSNTSENDVIDSESECFAPILERLPGYSTKFNYFKIILFFIFLLFSNFFAFAFFEYFLTLLGHFSTAVTSPILYRIYTADFGIVQLVFSAHEWYEVQGQLEKYVQDLSAIMNAWLKPEAFERNRKILFLWKEQTALPQLCKEWISDKEITVEFDFSLLEVQDSDFKELDHFRKHPEDLPQLPSLANK